MALVSKSIPNFINGISQQPPSLRLASQGEAQENGYSDIVEGLKKRPPTKFLKNLRRNHPITGGVLTASELSKAFIHTYKRSAGEQFTVLYIPSTATETTFSSWSDDPALIPPDTVGSSRPDGSVSNGGWTRDDSFNDSSVYPVGMGVIRNYDNSANNQGENSINFHYWLDPFTGKKYEYSAFNADVDAETVYRYYEINKQTGTRIVQYGGDLSSSLSVLQFNTTYLGRAASQIPATTKGGELFVYDINGNLRYQSGVASWKADGTQIQTNGDDQTVGAYFGTELSDNITATSVADFTFLVNKNKVVTRNETFANNARPFEGLFYLKKSDYGRTYRCKVLNSTTSAVVFSGFYETLVAGGSNDTEYRSLKTGLIMDVISGKDTSGNLAQSSSTMTFPSTYLRGGFNRAPFFTVSNSTTDFKIQVSDDEGGTSLFAHKDSVATFTELPKFCTNGLIIQVNGDNQKKEDDFYVKYTGDESNGAWKECPAPSRPNDSQYHSFTASTMPHTLVQNSNESFSFTTGTWDERKAGDDNTNPFPSFVGGKINDVFFHRNRLGFLSDENVIFSESNGFFNFFRTTVRSLLDSAPIDVAVSQNEVSILKAAVPFQEQLLLFSEINQFTLSSDQLLTPAEVSIDTSTNFECDLTAKPVGAGNSVFFSVQNGTFSGMREYYTTGDTEVKDANLITAHVPNYLAGSVKQMVASTNENLLLVRTTTDAKELYVYKWYENETERLQSSWSKWKFDVNIAHVAFNNEEIFIVFEDGRFENMTLTIDAQLLNIYPMHLDHQQKFTSGAPSMGYTDSNLVYYNSKGEQVTATTTASSAIPVYGGIPYTFKYQLSEQVFKPDQGDSSDIARFQLRTISFTYNDTGTFTVTQTNGRRDPTSAVFTGRLLGDLDNVLDQSAIDTSGNFKVGVQSQAKEAKIEITNASPLPSVFQKAEWEGFVKLRSTRI